MLRSTSGTRWFVALMIASWQSAALAADLPTADEILRIHRTNKERLSQLHLRLVQRYETTEAFCRYAQKQAALKKQFLKGVDRQNPDNTVITGADGKRIDPALIRLIIPELEREVATLRGQSKPFQLIRPMEFFQNGDDYQFRSPLHNLTTAAELAAWRFPDSPLTAETLLTDYRNIYIFSRSAKAKPAARWWHHSADGVAYVTHKHLTDVNLVRIPPFTDVTHPRWDMRHPFDAFFSQSADKYRVVRNEEIDGRSLTVVDVAMPIAKGSNNLLAYRGWLDLKRGAVPIKLYHRQNQGEAPKNQFDHEQPDEIVTTHEMRELPNGGYYAAKTVSEFWNRDPEAPEPTAAEWDEVKAGKRRLALVVHRRYAWECSVVEVKTGFDDGFFMIPFPAGQQVFDHDMGKMIGALDAKPLVQVGQRAPPLSIAHWLDGKLRTQSDWKGQVVVLDFWGLWCGACRSSVPRLKAIQDLFRDEPVTFIGIYNAEKDSMKLAARIREFKTKNQWKFTGAIDTGTMLENSVTANAYGVRGFPTLVIIGTDGRIVYVDLDLDGPRCDEKDPTLLAMFQRQANDLMKERFHSVGETWPIPNGLDETQQAAIYERVERAFITLQIESALKKAR